MTATFFHNGVRIDDSRANMPSTIRKGEPFQVQFVLRRLDEWSPGQSRIEVEVDCGLP
jgi:hypothetical protein